jgi:type I restriction enzyme S subunit
MTNVAWESLTLGDLGKWVTGSTPASSDHANKGDDVLFVTPGDIGAGGKLGEVARRISNIGADRVRRIKPGSVILVCIGTIGKVAWTDLEITTNQQINTLEVDQSKFDVKFVHWLLTSPRIQELLWQNSTSTTVALINKKTLEKIPCSIPSLEEQQRIVETLDEQLSRIDKSLAELHGAQEMLKSVTRSLLHKVLHGTGSTRKLSELCSLITDGSHFSPKTVSQGLPYITVRDISKDEIDFDGCKYISAESYEELEKNGCRPLLNDVLFSKDGTVGKVAVVSSDKPFVVLSSLAILRPDQQKILPSFLKLALKSPIVLENALGMKTGTAIRRVVLRNLKNLEIDVPSLEEQRQIVKYVDTKLESLTHVEKTLESQVAKLYGLKRSMLNAAFTGKILEDS